MARLSPSDTAAAVAANTYHDLTTQAPTESNMHAMAKPGQSQQDATKGTADFIAAQMGMGSSWAFGKALHDLEDTSAPAHAGYPEWNGGFDPIHFMKDANIFDPGFLDAIRKDMQAMRLWQMLQNVKRYPQTCGTQG